MYIVIKNAHITFAIVSISLFVIRSSWSIFESSLLERKWVKVLPHLNDTLLLSCAIYLVIASRQYPLYNDWLTAKVIALFLYIGFGTYAIKRGKTAGARLFFTLLSIAVFSYIFAVATTRSVWF